MQETNSISNNLEYDNDKVIFGFWVYIMTDCILFASLFAIYAVLHNNTFGGPLAKTIFSLPYALTETLILLTSSFTCGLAVLSGRKGNKNAVISFLIITFILGASFISMEVNEFSHLISQGNSFQRSGFLSSFFVLVGTHGLHVTTALGWMAVTGIQILKRGITPVTNRKLVSFSLFWHFLDIVWIFIFSIVYLMGFL